MWGIGRRAAPPPPPPQSARPDPVAQRAALRSIAAEALIRQDEAEAVLRDVRARVSLGVVARRGGPLVRRFFALPPHCAHPDDDRLRGMLDKLLHSHAMVVSVSLDLLACEWRSERLAAQLDQLDGLGAPARILEHVFDELSEPIDLPATTWSGPEELIL